MRRSRCPRTPRPSTAPTIPTPRSRSIPGAPDETLTPIEPGPIDHGESIDVGLGYTIRPPGGWTVVSQEDDVTVLQKGATLLVIGAVPSADTPEDLATWYRDAWFQDGGYTGGDPESRTIGDGIPGAQLDYTGAFDGTAVDGRIVAASEDGAGLLVNAFAPTGSLAEAAPDLEAILDSVRLGGG